jgi:hypothetical protein
LPVALCGAHTFPKSTCKKQILNQLSTFALSS